MDHIHFFSTYSYCSDRKMLILSGTVLWNIQKLNVSQSANIIEMIKCKSKYRCRVVLKNCKNGISSFFFVCIVKKDRTGFLVGLKMHL